MRNLEVVKSLGKGRKIVGVAEKNLGRGVWVAGIKKFVRKTKFYKLLERDSD